MTELNNNVIGILEPMTPYMLRNDGVLLSCGTVHPYIKMSNSDTYENNLKTLERHPEFLTWFLSNSTNNETKALLNEFETNKSEDLLNKLNDLTNQEFCRVRTSNYKQKYGGNNGQIYFRISSVGFNWFELIWKVVARFSSIIKEVTIVKDNQTFGGREFNYYCNHMPSDEFLTMKGNPIMENKNALLESLTAAQKQKLSDVWDYLEQNDFIDIDNCTDDALALRNIDENLVEKLKAMLGKSPATLQHLASFLEAHTFETLMNLGLFKDTQIKSVNIPNSVASIGNEAFADCKSLTSVTIPNSVTSIGEYAFYRCGSLTSVIIPNSVTIISDDAFYRCGSLTSVIIPDSVTIISDGAFADCESLASVNIPNSVTSIGNWAFSDCHVLASVDIPNSVTSIGASAFYRCKSLTSVDIPNSVTSIGNVAFANCESLASVNIPNSVASIGNGAFANCESLASVDIPNSVTSIGDAAFYSCESLTSVNIPNSVASIGKDTFSWCKSLTSVNIPNSVASIGNEAFSYCYSLESIILEKGIDKSVEDKLRKEYGTKVKLQENLTESLTAAERQKLSDVWDYLEQNDFIDIDNCTDEELALRNIDENLVEKLQKLFGKSTVISNFTAVLEAHTFETLMNLGLFKVSDIKSVTIPNSVTSIGNEAFADCYLLTSVDIPNSVTSIGNGAFSTCKSLTSVNIPNSVASIGDAAFADCESLTSVNIPNSVASIGIWAFSDCHVLASVDIPNSVTSIGNGTFYDCASLTSITIPNSVASIGDEAFSYCYSLESIILEKGIDKSVEDKLRKEYGTKVKLQENLAENLTQLEESPEKHDTLNPKLWDIEKNELKPEVSDKVLEIAKDFTDGLDEDEVKYKLLDVKLVGSNCSYNYNKASDLDVHLVFDLSIYDDDEKEKMAELLYNYARSLWNKNHTVEFYGIPVEIYVETENSEDKNILENADKENDLTPREEELIIEASKGPFEEISFEDLCKL